MLRLNFGAHQVENASTYILTTKVVAQIILNALQIFYAGHQVLHVIAQLQLHQISVIVLLALLLANYIGMGIFVYLQANIMMFVCLKINAKHCLSFLNVTQMQRNVFAKIRIYGLVL